MNESSGSEDEFVLQGAFTSFKVFRGGTSLKTMKTGFSGHNQHYLYQFAFLIYKQNDLMTYFKQILKTLTVGYNQYLRQLDPTMPQFQVPRRILTKPIEGVLNDGMDNKEFDFILVVQDALINNKKKHKYIIDELLGKGTFGQVVKCHKENTKEYFAIKVIKNQAVYSQQCLKEIEVLRTLQTTPDKTPCPQIIQLLDQFVHFKHICLVFPILSYTLLDVLKDNKFLGMGVRITRKWVKLILQGLLRAELCGVLHADLKPENIMIEEDSQNPENSNLRIIDFGSSCFLSKLHPYTYIQSRFYRAPEIILRQSKYTTKIDMWSLGCITAELLCGIALIPGADEYTCLQRILQITEQQFTHELYQSSPAAPTFFYEYQQGIYKIKPQQIFEKQQNVQVKGSLHPPHPISKLTDLKQIYEESLEEIPGSEPSFEIFLDFLKKLLCLKPEDRMSASEALEHQFIVNQQQQKRPSFGFFIVNKISQKTKKKIYNKKRLILAI